MTTNQLAAVEGLRGTRAALRPLAVPMAVVAFALLTAVVPSLAHCDAAGRGRPLHRG